MNNSAFDSFFHDCGIIVVSARSSMYMEYVINNNFILLSFLAIDYLRSSLLVELLWPPDGWGLISSVAGIWVTDPNYL